MLGIIGSFTATAAIVLPSFIIVLALARFYMKFRNNAFFGAALIASMKFKIGPIPIILAGGVAGLLQY